MNGYFYISVHNFSYCKINKIKNNFVAISIFRLRSRFSTLEFYWNRDAKKNDDRKINNAISNTQWFHFKFCKNNLVAGP